MTRPIEFTAADWRRILSALGAAERDHRAARIKASERALDPAYEWRAGALEAEAFHAGEVHDLSLLVAKVWRQVGEAEAAEKAAA